MSVKLMAPLLAVLALPCFASPGSSQSIMGTIEQKMRQLDRAMCERNPTAKCRAASAQRNRQNVQSQQKNLPLPAAKDTPAPLPHLKPRDLVAAGKSDREKPVKAATSEAASIRKDQSRLAGGGDSQAGEGLAKSAGAPGAATTTVATSSPKTSLPEPVADKKAKESKVASRDEGKQKALGKKAVLPPVADSQCLVGLSGEGGNFAPVPQPTGNAACQIADPVRLVSVEVTGGKVKLPDQPIVACTFARRLTRWVQTEAAPITYSNLNTALVAMGTGPGFDCRGRNGDASAKMSEHAIGNAVDIEYLKLADGTVLRVRQSLDTKDKGFATLRDLRASACKSFTTVLGPGANSAHQEHFHFDLEKRKVAGTYQICQ